MSLLLAFQAPPPAPASSRLRSLVGYGLSLLLALTPFSHLGRHG